MDSNLNLVNDERTYEKINGEMILIARPTFNHCVIAGNIYNVFKNFLKGKTCCAVMEPDVFLDDDNNFAPDVVIVCDKDKIKYKGILGAPDLVVEILSPSTAKRDLNEKKSAYASSGVKEYWIVSPLEKAIYVFYLQEDKSNVHDVYYYRTDEEKQDMKEDDLKALVEEFRVGFYNDLVVSLKDVFDDLI